MTKITLNVYGVRGSAPISGDDYVRYGGNTASYTLRTTSNSLIFLDAGTGLRFAEEQLSELASKVLLVISHTHADHIQGFGMTHLPFLSDVEGYRNQLLRIVGPPGTSKGLRKFYDGEHIWPVRFTADTGIGPRMFGVDYGNIHEYSKDLEAIQIDGTTSVTLLKGNHPVSGGVILYRFELKRSDGPPVIIVYATDNEFDFVNIDQPNPGAEDFKKRYQRFVSHADILIADAQYTKQDYYHQFQGYGHSYHQQVIDLAEASGVKLLLLTHHHLYKDDRLDELKKLLSIYLREQAYSVEVVLAKEGSCIQF